MIIASPNDFRIAARRRLPRFLWDYLEGGACNEETLHRNQQDLRQVLLRQRVLCEDVSQCRLETRLFGRDLSVPIVLSPIGIAGLYARRGEAQGKRAADSLGIPFCLSTVSVCPMAEVARQSTVPFWFQLYVMRDRGFMRELIEEAARLRVGTLVFTVDMPVAGIRYRDARSGLSGRFSAWRRSAQSLSHPRWTWDVGVRGRPHVLGNIVPTLGQKAALNDFMEWIGANFDPSIRWRDLDLIRSIWNGPLIVKGILDREDAVRAAELGVDGIVVSNHGGRQHDGVSSTARALPALVDAVGERLTVMVDSGVRSGLDIVRMLALGAKAVWLGRLWIYALSTAGEAGVYQLLEILTKEMRVAMALCGCKDLQSLNRDILM